MNGLPGLVVWWAGSLEAFLRLQVQRSFGGWRCLQTLAQALLYLILSSCSFLMYCLPVLQWR